MRPGFDHVVCKRCEYLRDRADRRRSTSLGPRTWWRSYNTQPNTTCRFTHGVAEAEWLANRSAQGMVVDFSRYMRRMQVDRTNRTVYRSVRFDVGGPEPQHQADGAMVRTRPRHPKHHDDRRNARRQRFGKPLLAKRIGTRQHRVDGDRHGSTGELLDVSRHSPEEPGTVGRWARGLVEIQHQYQEAIAKWIRLLRQEAGYRLDGVIGEDGRVDLAKFLVGTQGTLALTVDATLKTESIPRHRGVIMLFFHRLESAARSAVRSLQFGPVACDMMGRRLLGIARETERQFENVLPREAEAMLLIELQGDSLDELSDRIEIVQKELSRGVDAAFAANSATDQESRDRFWALCPTSDSTTQSPQGAGNADPVYRRHCRFGRAASASVGCDPKSASRLRDNGDHFRSRGAWAASRSSLHRFVIARRA